MSSKKFNVQDDFANEVAQKFIKAMNEGTSIFHKDWKKSVPMPPMNPTTNNTYSGVNFLNLSLEQVKYGDPRWLTFKQAKELGAKIKKGEKGTRILYWKTHNLVDRKDSKGNVVLDPEGKKIKDKVKLEYPRAFYSTVFNASQIDGLDPYIAPEFDLDSINDQVERMVTNTGADIRHGGDMAFYRHSTDHIQMPLPQQFQSLDGYYSTLAHELGHWTGHQSRLDREFGASKGDEAYAREELRAELCSYMLNVKLGVEYNPERHFGYINSWVKVLENDPNEIVRASATAEKMSEYLISFDRGVNQLVDPELVQQKTKQAKSLLVTKNQEYFNDPSLTGEELKQRDYLKEVYDSLDNKLQKDLLIEVDKDTHTIYVYSTLARLERDQGDRKESILSVKANDSNIKFTVNTSEDFRSVFVKRENGSLDSLSLKILENEINEIVEENNLGQSETDFEQKTMGEISKGIPAITVNNGEDIIENTGAFIYATPEEKEKFKEADNVAKKMFNYNAKFRKLAHNSKATIYFEGSHKQILSTRVEIENGKIEVASGVNQYQEKESVSSETERYEQVLIHHLERDQHIAKNQIKEIYANADRFEGNKSFLKELAINRIKSNPTYSVIDTILEKKEIAEKGGIDFKVVQVEGDTAQISFDINGNKLPFHGLIFADGKISLDHSENLNLGLEQYAGLAGATEILHFYFNEDSRSPYLARESDPKVLNDISKLISIEKDEGVNFIIKEYSNDKKVSLDTFKNGIKLPTVLTVDKSGAWFELEDSSKVSVQDPKALIIFKDNDMKSDVSVATEKIYLNVSYDDRAEAKEMGAWFDHEGSKLWYVPVGTESKELINRFGLYSDRANKISKDPIEQFREALTSAGLKVDDIKADGKMHRVPLLDDKKGALNGAYALHLNQQIPGGYIANWRTGEKTNWRADVVVQSMTEEQKEILRQQQEQLRLEREKETQAMYEKTANIATKLWAEASPVKNNSYCDKKQIMTTNVLKTVPNEVSSDLHDMGVRIANSPMDFNKITNDPKNKGVDLYIFIKDSLLIPAVDTKGEIRTIQQVNQRKTFARGGEKSGHFYTTDGLPVNNKEIILTEGYATADAVHQITGKQVVATFDVGNLEAVALTLREQNPLADIIIASDNDHIEKVVNGKVLPNIGVEKAMLIAEKVNAVVVTPPFEKNDLGTDWNDLLVDKGIYEATDAFNSEWSLNSSLDMDR